MARECITNCPKIQKHLQQADLDRTLSGIGPFALGGRNVKDLMEQCEASYDCPGPKATEIEVTKGWFNKYVEVQPGFICQQSVGFPLKFDP